mmetsp:Transcript_21292/g.32954  ORF Transcript_21292/g.32954 Transcript_21292/m.32954 type:complete len:208 (-) Transcript_21292:1250-1873(-)
MLADSEGGLSPLSVACSKRFAGPKENDLAEESPSLALLVHNLMPLVEATGRLLGVHANDEVAHDLMSLLLHFTHQVLLLALILLHLDLEPLDRLLVVFLSAVELLDVVEVQLLALYTAHLLPNAEGLVGLLLVDLGAKTEQEFLCIDPPTDEESPRLVDVVLGGAATGVAEPLEALVHVLESPELLHLAVVFHEVVAQAPLQNDLLC